MDYKRYAIYFTPPPGPFADFGAGWLGWDPATGHRPPAPDIAGLPAAREDITATPRKYGLHATIKPPFRLADGQSAEALNGALRDLCGQLVTIRLDGLDCAALGRFLALVPCGDTTALDTLAARVVRDLDRFREPPSEAELTRRRSGGLSPSQEGLLIQWGYPYVMDEFRFHITLTGKLPKAQTAAVREILEPHITPLLPRPFTIDALSLMGEDDEGVFHLIHRHALSG